MFSVKATYENGKITLDEPLQIETKADIILTFLDEGFDESNSMDDGEMNFEGMRAHKRYSAKGNITVVENGQETDYPLNDYSAGGLSYYAPIAFPTDEHITATIKYNAAGEVLVMEFQMTVRRSVEKESQYLIGCQFLDSVDEELWHTIMS